MSRRRKSGIVNVTMVITQEKILSNIDKVQKMINPHSKKKIVELEEDSDFKDLIESIKSYLIEYPNKKNFPLDIYKATYGLVEFATTQFEENTKKIEDLIKQREENIALSGKLKEVIERVDECEDDEWNEPIKQISDKFSEDIIEALNVVGKSKTKKLQSYNDAMKLLHARVKNLESNLHIEIDIERLEDSSKALSYIGIEVADALKLIPTPEEQIEVIAEQNAKEEAEKVSNNIANEDNIANPIIEDMTEEDNIETLVEQNIEKIEEEQEVQVQQEQYVEDTTFEAKPSLWQRFKNSKFVKAATYVFRIRVRIELPSNALPEGRGENV